jgi:glycosyltransferase involved in cell wall biosynthesis
MTIAIDCRMLDSSGIGVYIRGNIPYFLQSPHTVILLGDIKKLLPFVQGYQNAEVLDCGVKPFSVKELLFFPGKIKRKINSADLFFTPYFNIPGGVKVPVYTTIHDIIFPDMPELTSKIGLVIRMWFYRRAFCRSQKIFTVSEFSRSRIRYYSKNKVPVAVTYSAIQPFFLEPEAGVHKKDSILFIGNIKKHKGLQTLLAAFADAVAGGLPHKLIIAGGKDNFRSADKSSLALLAGFDPSRVEFTGALSNNTLKTLLSEAALLVQPSLYEGFCLPPLEAMVCGTRALISDIPVLKEIYGAYPVTFFKAGDSRDLKEKLMLLLYGKRPDALRLSEENKNRYTFAKTAALILKELSC